MEALRPHARSCAYALEWTLALSLSGCATSILPTYDTSADADAATGDAAPLDETSTLFHADVLSDRRVEDVANPSPHDAEAIDESVVDAASAPDVEGTTGAADVVTIGPHPNPDTENTGWVMIENDFDDSNVFSMEWTAFDDADGYPLAPSCTATSEGACKIWHCPEPVAWPPVHFRNPGTLTIETENGTPLILPPNSDGSQASALQPTQQWHPGETVTLRATGGDLGDFNMSTLFPAPLRAFTASIPYDLSMMPSLNRADGFASTWEPDPTSGVSVTVSQVALDGNNVASFLNLAQCAYPSSNGHAEVPASVLAGFAPGTTIAGYGLFSVVLVANNADSVADVHGYTVHFIAENVPYLQAVVFQ